MIREANFDAQCAECGGKITAGERMEYLPPSGEWPARTSHPDECPERKIKDVKQARSVNYAQRRDPEEVLLWRTCGCGHDWTVPRDSLASRRETFVCPRCVDEAQTSERLKAVA